MLLQRPGWGFAVWGSCSVVGLHWWAGVCDVTKRRSSWACIGNTKPEQETIEGTHAQETPAYQHRPTILHALQGSNPTPQSGFRIAYACPDTASLCNNPPIRALYMQLAKISHTYQTTPRATSAAGADQHGTHRGRNRYHSSAHTTKDEAPGQLPGPKTRLDTEALAREAWPGLNTEYRLVDAKART